MLSQMKPTLQGKLHSISAWKMCGFHNIWLVRIFYSQIPLRSAFVNFPYHIPYPLECSPMGVKVLTQKRTVIITTVLFWGNTFTPMGLHSSGYSMLLKSSIYLHQEKYLRYLSIWEESKARRFWPLHTNVINSIFFSSFRKK